MSTSFAKLKTGEVLSESQFYVVEKIVGDQVQLKPDSGDSIVVDRNYAEAYLISGEQLNGNTTSRSVNKTEAAEIFLKNPNVAMTVSFNKQVKEADVTKEITDAYQNSTPKAFEAAVKKAVKKGLRGEERIITGYHLGNQDEFGRVHFLDLKIQKDPTKNYDVRQRLVDPRTINYIILKGEKIEVK